MADNVTANAGSGGAVFATDDDGTAHHPYVKLEFGADNTQTKVSSSDPLPVVQTGTHSVVASQSGAPWSVSSAGGSVAITGTVATSSAGGSVGITGTVATSSAGGSVGITGTVATSSAGGSVGITGTVATSSAPLTAAAHAITAKLATDAIHDGLTALTPKFTSISIAVSGASIVVTSVAAKKLRVLAYNLVVSGAASLVWQSDTTNKSGAKPFAANGGLVAPFSPVGWLETASAESLRISSSATVTVAGELVYVEV